MKTIAFQVHKAWLIPAVLVLVVTCLIYAIVGSIAKNPFPWIMVIPGVSAAIYVLLRRQAAT